MTIYSKLLDQSIELVDALEEAATDRSLLYCDIIKNSLLRIQAETSPFAHWASIEKHCQTKVVLQGIKDDLTETVVFSLDQRSTQDTPESNKGQWIIHRIWPEPSSTLHSHSASTRQRDITPPFLLYLSNQPLWQGKCNTVYVVKHTSNTRSEWLFVIESVRLC